MLVSLWGAPRSTGSLRPLAPADAGVPGASCPGGPDGHLDASCPPTRRGSPSASASGASRTTSWPANAGGTTWIAANRQRIRCSAPLRGTSTQPMERRFEQSKTYARRRSTHGAREGRHGHQARPFSCPYPPGSPGAHPFRDHARLRAHLQCPAARPSVSGTVIAHRMDPP